MYADEHMEKPTALGPTTPTTMLPAPIVEIHAHAHAHTHPLAHPHLHTLHAQHMQHMQMQQHLQHQQQQQQGQTQQQQQQQSHVNQQQQQHVVQHLTVQHQQTQSPLAVLQQQHQQQHHHQHQTHQHQHQQQHVHQQQQQTQQQQQQQQQTQAQQQSAMFTRFDANKSTKGASKLRRDLINAEIANLRDLLPLPQSTRQRLSQLQLMALVCVYVRKANYFQQVFKRHDISTHHAPTPNIGFSKALSGFLMMLTQNGKLLYISDNAAEYLGHSMEDLLIHGDSVYDIIDKQDHAAIQAELNRNVPPQPGHSQHANATAAAAAAISSLEGEHRMFLCRMNVSRNARRQMRFGDQKVVLVQGHYLSFLPLCSRNEPVFLATCTPIAMPETRECVVQGATNVFTTIHSMDMKIAHIDKNGEFHLGYSKSDIHGLSWYNLLHSENSREAQSKHRLITQSEQDRSCILLVRMQRRQGDFIWVHVVLQVRDSQDTNQQPVIVCTNQVLNEREASVMLANSWLYHYYSVQSKIQFGLAFDAPTRIAPTTPVGAAAVYYHHHAHHHAVHPHTHHHTGAVAAATALPATASTAYAAALHPHHAHAHAHHQHLHPHQHTQAHPHPHQHHQHPHHQYQTMTATAYATYHTPTGATSGGSISVGSTSGGSTESSPASHLSIQQSQQQQQPQHHMQNNGVGPMTVATNVGLINGSSVGQYVYHHRLGLEPVDYSQVPEGSGSAIGLNGARSPSDVQSDGQMRCSSANSSVSSHNAATPNYITHNNKKSRSNHNNNNNNNNTNHSHNNSQHNHQHNNGSSTSANGNASSARHQHLSSPPPKRRAIGKLQPLFLPDDNTDDMPTTVTEMDASYHLHSHTHALLSASAESHASVIFATVVPTRPRLIQKSLPNDPPDFIDQWNPSPPWSESAQKLSLDSSSSTQQELSPCITTTPPTPTSAPPIGPLSASANGLQTLGPAFSFEWMSDTLMPVADSYVSCITPPDGVPIVVAHHPHPAAQHSLHWPTNSTPSEHHQHLSQHLASHGHRLLTLSGGNAVQSAQLPIPMPDIETRKTKAKSPEVTDRKVDKLQQ
ncbi:uncharacterized protein dysf isoform X2 [Eurosta solidaginis]|uniref:uncharacterized protein dysf isoform X2 n=1 Tax=Eurosta solidaginis TaxID=178769 RepID=UPI003530B362